ncbi:MAG: nicotinate-nucleotide diphosphorylase (carboxylating) [Candidatus Altiarchaeales archaeon HGW-Altiarchaeales-3]|nr:MAG: nicotinate-nucleotide diphosphorylase (carboxylating) [Candidatus Altiarchaeales archaeon HGW-Altiarchaeales-3]
MHRKIIEKKLMSMIEEDGFMDITSDIVPGKTVDAVIIARGSAIISGILELKILFKLFNIEILHSLRDGDEFSSGDIVLKIKGNSRDILLIERTALNILSRMSGITTLTKQYVEKVNEVNPGVKIAATRKTNPLLGYFEKMAVRIGGGDTHRFSLGDCVLIKDTHLALFDGDVAKAVLVAKKKTSFTHKIEIEVSSIDDAKAAIGADIIMFDNMDADKIKIAVSNLRNNLNFRGILEASGGINLDNLPDYAKTGVDVLSIGALTKEAKSIDFSLRIL